MKTHRNPQASVSDTAPADNFNPGTGVVPELVESWWRLG